MAFNKKSRLRDNIEAIRIALDLDRQQRQATHNEQEALKAYCGFGGIKAVLNPAGKPEDVKYWTKSDSELFPLVRELHELLRSTSENAAVYNGYVSSLKNSVLSAFFTPPQVVEALAVALKESGVEPMQMLDPSAGTGLFTRAFKKLSPGCESTQFEKDLLTGKILSHLNPAGNIRIEGFEHIEPRYHNSFDIAASNIPFGDVRVFDPLYSIAKDAAHRQATGAIHNYFLMKGVECIREGGLVAFITSQGVLDSPSNRPVRQWLMQRCEPVSIVRFPDNLFIDTAGTQVGSDLIVLQKKTREGGISGKQQDFVDSRQLSNGISINNSFQDFSRVVHTDVKVGTDPYGKPAMEFTHTGGTDAIAKELGSMLREDFVRHLDVQLYRSHSPHVEHVGHAYKPTAQELQEMREMMELGRRKDRELFMQAHQDDFSDRLTREDYMEMELALKASKEGWWDTFAANRPYINDYLKLEQSTSLVDESVPVTTRVQPSEPTLEAIAEEPAYNIQNQPLLSLYDLFGLTAKERTQTKRRSHSSHRRTQNPESTDESRQKIQKDRMTAGRTEERRKQDKPESSGHNEIPDQHADHLEQERAERSKPVPFVPPGQKIPTHYREGSLVANANNRIGYLREMQASRPMFHPLELPPQQQKRASLYIEIRDTYHQLYLNEADTLRENPALREMLNRLYEDFKDKFGNLNDQKNLDLIKMDPSGREILSLEHYREGKAVKAEIFERPVAFNTREITHADNARDALAASLNKHGVVDPGYMALLTGVAQESLLEELKGKVYFNPLTGSYEVSEKFIAGNVISKAEEVQQFLENHPGHELAGESLTALREAIPRPIGFDELDFNFGERWIPTGIYAAYASYLFETDVKINYAASADEFSIHSPGKNAKILTQYAVRSDNRLFDGVALMRHALHDTTPEITKTFRDGEREIKVPDGQAIQLANSKIDEIRSGFPDWLHQQSPEFKQRLADMYNRTFNCFVRPEYDGSHQEFPGLDLKALGIDGLYRSQKDAVWMLKTNGGGLVDHEVLRP